MWIDHKNQIPIKIITVGAIKAGKVFFNILKDIINTQTL